MKSNQKLYDLVIKPCNQTDPGSLQCFKRLLPMIVNFYVCNFCKWKFERHTDYLQHMNTQHENVHDNNEASTPSEDLLNKDDNSENFAEKLDEEQNGSFQNLSISEKEGNVEANKILSNKIAYESLIEEKQCLICG